MLLQVLYSVRSERALMDQMDLHLGFRWFAGLSLSDPVWDASAFSKNRERLLGGDIAVEFLNRRGRGVGVATARRGNAMVYCNRGVKKSRPIRRLQAK